MMLLVSVQLEHAGSTLRVCVCVFYLYLQLVVSVCVRVCVCAYMYVCKRNGSRSHMHTLLDAL